MFGGVTALLEKIDQHVEAIAEEQERAEAEEEEEEALKHATAAAGGFRRGSEFPALSPIAVPSPIAHGARRTFDSPSLDTVSNIHNAAARGGPVSSSSAAGSSRQPQQHQQHTNDDGTASMASSSSHFAKHQQQHASSTSSAGGRLASLFTGAGSAPSAQSLTLQCASLQQSLAMLEEELQLAQTALAEKQATMEHLDKKYSSAEAERARWQREATYYKDIATTSRDQLTRCEGELRVLTQLHEETGKELTHYKASSKRLIEEKEAEVLELKRQLQSGSRASAEEVDSSATLTSANARIAELETVVVQLRATQRDDELEKLHLQNVLATAERERERQQQRQQQLEQQVDSLQLDVRALTESLEGEHLAHQEVTAQLKETRNELQAAQVELELAGRDLQASPQRGSADTATGEVAMLQSPTAAAAAVARLEDALSEAQQRCQVLSFQLLERQTALDASAREVVEWHGRYNALARRIGDDEVAAAAGYGMASASGGLSFPKPPGVNSRTHDGGAEVAVHVAAGRAVTGGPTSGGSGISHSNAVGPGGDLKRNPTMLHLARKGKLGRVTVELLAKADDVVLRLAHHLRHRAVARVAVESYVCLLQVWVLLIFLSNLVMATDSD